MNDTDYLSLEYQKAFTAKISSIANPLYKAYGASFFSHVRAFHDGRFAHLMTNTALTEYYLKQEYSFQHSEGQGISLNNGIYVVSNHGSLSSEQHGCVLKDTFNLKDMIYLVDKQSTFDDLYIFAAETNRDNFVNLFFNNLDSIKNYIHYYKQHAHNILIETPKVKYPEFYFQSDNVSSIASPTKTPLTFPIKKVYLPIGDNEISISAQEFKTLKLTLNNYTLKEIAKLMSLSPRTVETYQTNLKNKLNCNSIFELVQLAKSIQLL